MQLAVVRGLCTATVKDQSLAGRRLVLVQGVTPQGKPDGPVEVALDVTSAASGQLVLLSRGSAARQAADNRQLAVDLSVVAIVDEVSLTEVPSTVPGAASTRSRTTSAAKTPRQSARTGGK
ncbi:MAG: hypothetical protein M3237_04810 [Actinomycetota bacterium]|nr:hypothetical protein [Actinomycetota bacterium]